MARCRRRSIGLRFAIASLFVSLAAPSLASAQAASEGALLTFKYTPAPRAQLALWIEDAAGKFLATVALTESVAYRGIGNRPGASLMNSGYRWPYGRREGVLPIWAHRRAAAPGAKLFPRVIFQSRVEGMASKRVSDESVDTYYCLGFDISKSSREKLDAVTCASVFNSDKGRYLTEADVAAGYSEPWQDMKPGANGGAPEMVGSHKPLPLKSLYPPRLDVTRCTDADCYDHADVDRYAKDAREVMPEIDAVSLATPPGDVPQSLLFSVPADWPAGDYVAFVEVGLEGDYNTAWNDKTYPTPFTPAEDWDNYAEFYGYPYRGQPSLVWKIPFRISATGTRQFAADVPEGRTSWEMWSTSYGAPDAISSTPNDPNQISADLPASGIDRLRRDAEGHRVVLEARGAVVPPPEPGTVVDPDAGVPAGVADDAIGPIEELSLALHPDPLRAHTWVLLHLRAARSSAPLHAYEVRVSTEPITDEISFIRDGRQAKNATDAAEGATLLSLPVNVPAGAPIDATIGDLVASTHYYVGVRATDELNRHGPISVAEITTPERRFATVTPCFIATAAYGSPLAQEVAVLRHARDRYLMPLAPGRAAVQGYYAVGAPLAAAIAEHEGVRAALRVFIDPLVRLARLLP